MLNLYKFSIVLIVLFLYQANYSLCFELQNDGNLSDINSVVYESAVPAILNSISVTDNDESNYDKVGKDPALLDDLPDDFPEIVIDVLNNPAPGYTFMNSISFQQKTVNYNFILDSSGEVYYYYKPLINGIDFKMQPNGLFSYGSPVKMGDKYQVGPLTVQNIMVVENILDSSFNLIDQVQMKNGYLADVHDFQILPNGNYLLIAYESNPIDMSKIIEGGNPNANVIGTVFQELDINKNCVFQWRSMDYIPILETIDNPFQATFEHVHGNSVFLDTDGNLIVCLPTTLEVVKIDMISGEMLWRFGGKHNEFEFINEHEENAPFYFRMQHDVKKLANGNILMYDNGVGKSTWYSRAVEYAFDEENKTAELVWEYRHDPDIKAYAMGSAQRLDNGNTLINWGLIFAGLYKTLTEVTPDNQIAFEVSLPSDAYSYRSFKYDLPACQPVADVEKYEILQGNTYNYKDKNSDTGVEIYYKELDAFIYNYTNVKKMECAPLYPEFEGEAPVILPYRFIFSAQMMDSFSGEILFDIELLDWLENPERMNVYFRPTPDSGTFVQLESRFDPTEKRIIGKTSGFGEYIIGYDREATELFAPSLMQPSNNKSIINLQPVMLNWSPTGRYDYFQLQISDTQDFSNIILDSTDIKTPIITIPDLEADKTYYWRTRTFYRLLESEWSDIWSFGFTEPFISMEYPDGGESLTKDSVDYIIRWNTNSIDSVKISLFKNGAEYEIIKDSLLSYTNAFLWKIPITTPVGNDYTIQVRSIKDNELIAESADYFAIRENAIGIQDNTYNEDLISALMISPNPAGDNAKISFNLLESNKVKMTITDQLGNELKTLINTYLSSGTYQLDFNTSNLQSGIYFCHIRSRDINLVEKLIIVK